MIISLRPKIMNFKAWADHLMSQGRVFHQPRNERNGAGENTAWSEKLSPTMVAEAVRATKWWYDEIEKPGYNFNNPGRQSGAAHFTQV